MSPRLLRYAAFSRDPAGGNPAGVWVGDRLPARARMQAIATDVGYSETAFVAAADATGRREVRYFSPAAEVPFCGHATIAAAVALGDLGHGERHRLQTRAGEVEVGVSVRDGGRMATLVSVPPRHAPVPEALLREALAALDWREDELDPSIPPALAFAGAWHLVLAMKARRIFFKDSRDIAAQLERWRGKRLERLVARLVDLHRSLLSNSPASETLLAQALTGIAAAGRR